MKHKSMSRRRFVNQTIFLAGSVVAQPIPWGWCRTKPLRPPNFLILAIDDLRRDALGCYGNPVVQTPAIDHLASQGVQFEEAFVTSPSNLSQPGLLTGIHERTHGYSWETPSLPAIYTDASYPQLLRESGYRTGLVGKSSIRFSEGAREKMFEFIRTIPRTPFMLKVNGKQRQSSEHLGDLAAEFLDGCREDQPFALALHFHDAHASDNDPRQYWWPASTDHLYRDRAIPPLSTPTADPRFFNRLPFYLTTHFDRQRWWQRYWSPQRYQEMVRGYYRVISGVDLAIGRLRKELQKRDLHQNTVIFLTAENGTFLGERGFGGKYLIYDIPLRVPFLVYDPRQPATTRGQRSKTTVLNLDLTPTVLEMAGVENPSWTDGVSLVPTLSGSETPLREGFLCQHLGKVVPSIIETEGYRTQRWKYLRYRAYQNSEELYDLHEDPHEAVNLAVRQKHQKNLYELRIRCNEVIRQAEERRKNAGLSEWRPWTAARPLWMREN